MARSLKRSFGFAAFGAPFVLVVALSACGDDDDAAGGSTVLIQPSSHVTAATTAAGATTAPGGTATAGQPGDTSAAEQTYEIQGGDNLYAIASDFEIEAEDIANYNNWAEGINHSLHPGDSIRIPPGAVVPSPDDDEDEESESTDEESEESEETTAETDDEGAELCPDGEPMGTYEIQAGDIPGQVANQLDVTLEQLNEANANTPGYSGFIVGVEIVVPCGGDIEATETTEE